jgi:hypothetical protein
MTQEEKIQRAVRIGKLAYPHLIVSLYTNSKRERQYGEYYNIKGGFKNKFILIETSPTSERPSYQLGIVRMPELLYAVKTDLLKGNHRQLKKYLIKPAGKRTPPCWGKPKKVDIFV